MNFDKTFNSKNGLMLSYFIVLVVLTIIHFLIPQNGEIDRLINGIYFSTLIGFGLFVRYKIDNLENRRR